MAEGKRDDRGWDGWMVLPTQWTWVWTNLEREWRRGKPGVLQSMRSQRVGHSKWLNNNFKAASPEKWTLLHCWLEYKFGQPLWSTERRFLKKTKNRIAVWASSPTPEHISRENSNLKRCLNPNVHSSTIYHYLQAKIWKQPKCPLTGEWIKKTWYIHTMEY